MLLRLGLGLLLGLSAVLGDDSKVTSTSNSVNDVGPETLEQSLPTRRCVPTAVARGPCHVCLCSEGGAYRCSAQECSYEDREVKGVPSQPECEPDMLYNDGALWCPCSAHGFWQSTDCRATFRAMQRKLPVGRQGSSVPPQACEAGSVYAVGCNLCLCRGGALTAGACTHRTCRAGSKADLCRLGNVLRVDNQLCPCNRMGIYIERNCVSLPNNASVQKLSSRDVAKLTSLDGEVSPLREKCTPHSVIQRDCNRCTCTATGQLACTSLLCLSNETMGQNVSMTADEALRTGSDKRSSLPELKSDREPCAPGRQYRLGCNTCYCTRQGTPACTTMMCLHYSPNKAQRLKNTHDLYQLPKISEGEKCIQGKTYRMDCNACRCGADNHLVCTKKLCLSRNEINRQMQFEHQMKNKNKKLAKKYPFIDFIGDKVILHRSAAHGILFNRKSKSNDRNKVLRTDKKVNKGDAQKESNKSQEEKPSTKSGSYPQLPATKCRPGQIYMKGCQRCFCNYKKIAQCTNRPCEEMKGPVLVPKDVYPRISPKEIDKLPSLPHEAARCSPGRAYTVECNVCLCLANGNLLCNTQLCLAVGEINRLAAFKHSGKSCRVEEGKIVPEVEADCISCSCAQGRLSCAPAGSCVPLRVRRALHGPLRPRAAPRLSLDTARGDSCVPGLLYKNNCNNCYCQNDGSLRCTRKGCLNYQQVQKLKEQRQRLLKLGL